MKKSNRRIVYFRRKREGKTNYHKRLDLLKSKMLRLVIRKTSKNIIAQIIMYEPAGDKIVVSANSSELKKFGWDFEKKNLPSSYLVGYLIGKKAISKDVKEAILDIGEHRSIKKTRIYAALKGAIDSGLIIPCSEEALPDDKRVSGQHIAEYAKKLKSNQELYNKSFSYYIKNNLNPEEIEKVFEQVKKKIKG